MHDWYKLYLYYMHIFMPDLSTVFEEYYQYRRDEGQCDWFLADI